MNTELHQLPKIKIQEPPGQALAWKHKEVEMLCYVPSSGGLKVDP